MINVLIDHSYEDDYFAISHISVELEDELEKARIEKIINESNYEGRLVDLNDDLHSIIADWLNISVAFIDIDVNEIDI